MSDDRPTTTRERIAALRGLARDLAARRAGPQAVDRVRSLARDLAGEGLYLVDVLEPVERRALLSQRLGSDVYRCWSEDACGHEHDARH